MCIYNPYNVPQLIESMNQMSKDISLLKNDNGILKTKVDTLTTDVSNLKDDIKSLNSKVDDGFKGMNAKPTDSEIKILNSDELLMKLITCSNSQNKATSTVPQHSEQQNEDRTTKNQSHCSHTGNDLYKMPKKQFEHNILKADDTEDKEDNLIQLKEIKDSELKDKISVNSQDKTQIDKSLGDNDNRSNANIENKKQDVDLKNDNRENPNGVKTETLTSEQDNEHLKKDRVQVCSNNNNNDKVMSKSGTYDDDKQNKHDD